MNRVLRWKSIKAESDWDKTHSDDSRPEADRIELPNGARVEFARTDGTILEAMIVDRAGEPLLRVRKVGYDFGVEVPENGIRSNANLVMTSETGQEAKPLYPPALEAPVAEPVVEEESDALEF